MAQGNEYISKEKNTRGNSKKNEKTSSPPPKKTKKTLNINKLNQKKAKNIIGAALLLLSCYFFLACLSYLFTWQSYQDRVINKSLIEFLFDGNTTPVDNWLGKFGAWSSHLLIYKWFGLSSFGFCILLFISGIKILLDYAILPIKKTYTVTFLFMIWGALFLGFFSNKINYLGGSFGFHINQLLEISLGRFGAFALIILLLYLTIVILFNPNFKALFRWFKQSSRIDEEENII